MRFDDEKQFATFLGRNVFDVKKARKSFAPLLVVVVGTTTFRDDDKRDDDADDDDAKEEEEEESNAPCANPRAQEEES
jgi:hypothetical protein